MRKADELLLVPLDAYGTKVTVSAEFMRLTQLDQPSIADKYGQLLEV